MLSGQEAQNDPDDAIRATDDDAAASRLSAVTLGYLDDPYTSLLYKPPRMHAGPSAFRKAPLINVGTHHRTAAIDLLVDKFLDQAGPNAQIVSLGAGSDTRYWRLQDKSRQIRRYVEVDFPHITSIKAQRISRSPKLSSRLGPAPASSSTSAPSGSSASGSSHTDTSTMLPPPAPREKPYTVQKGGTQLVSDTYILLPLDLRQHPSSTLSEQLLPHLDRTAPVLFLAECVFCYMSPELSADILGWFGRTFDTLAGVIYEMCGLQDTFGQVMRRNLAARHLSLPGAEPFPDVASQAARFVDPSLGEGVFQQSGAKSLWDIRQSVIDPDEITRISKLEFLDEIEELRLVLNHYCVAWGTKSLSSVSL